MILLDVNVTVAAFRADHPHHQPVRRWFDEIGAGDEPFTVPDSGWASFVRIVTNRRIFPVPSPVTDAFEFLRAVQAQPRYLPTTSGDRHLAIFEELCVDGQAAGDLVPDAYLAAQTLEQGARLATLDRDFTRFDAIETVRPIIDEPPR